MPTAATYVDDTICKMGAMIEARCYVPMKFGPLLYSEGHDSGDSFVVSRRLYRSKVSTVKPKGGNPDLTTDLAVIRTGYRELYLSSLFLSRTKCCHHSGQLKSMVTLDHGCVAHVGVGLRSRAFDQFLIINLTTDNSAARWVALVEFHRHKRLGEARFAMVRVGGCCMNCAIKQAQSDRSIGRLIL